MKDINFAIDTLNKENLTCVIAKGDCVYKSQKRGVAPIMELIKQGVILEGFSVADRVIGKAAALLFVLAGIKEVYSPVISKPALEVFKSNNIKVAFDNCVPYIINRTGDGRCPMEEAVKNIDSPNDAFVAIQAKIKTLSQNK